MEHMKSARSPLILLAVLAAIGALALGGCGGGSSSSGSSGEEPAMSEEKPAATGGEAVVEGEKVFAANCATCHTLKAAKATGTTGPNLDELRPSAATVEHQVINGGGPMPAFGKEGTLDEEEIEDVSTYVTTVAGK
jgi:mono/diheme cytochrome c family protein